MLNDDEEGQNDLEANGRRNRDSTSTTSSVVASNFTTGMSEPKLLLTVQNELNAPAIQTTVGVSETERVTTNPRTLIEEARRSKLAMTFDHKRLLHACPGARTVGLDRREAILTEASSRNRASGKIDRILGRKKL